MKSLWIKKLTLALSSMVFCALCLLLLEVGTRFFRPDINFQDSERSLWRAQAFGGTYGWQPNASGISFGKRVVIDEFGFRDLTSPQTATTSWLILGDSVTFGPGVEAEETFVQLLQNETPSVKLWNTAALGYNLEDYRNLLQYFTVESHGIKNVKKVILFLCLNDIILARWFEHDTGSRPLSRHLYESAYSFLTSSKFFILIKNEVSDRSKVYFSHDLQLYEQAGQDFKRALGMLGEMRTSLKARDIDFTVVVLPYEYQLRTKDERNLLPQRVLKAYFEQEGITYLDAYEPLASSGADAKENFLYSDAMHFSARGHREIFNFLRGKIKAE